MVSEQISIRFDSETAKAIRESITKNTSKTGRTLSFGEYVRQVVKERLEKDKIDTETVGAEAETEAVDGDAVPVALVRSDLLKSNWDTYYSAYCEAEDLKSAFPAMYPTQ